MQNKLLLILKYSYNEYTYAQWMKIRLSRITSVLTLLIILRKIFTVRKINIPNLLTADRYKWPTACQPSQCLRYNRPNIVRNFNAMTLILIYNVFTSRSTKWQQQKAWKTLPGSLLHCLSLPKSSRQHPPLSAYCHAVKLSHYVSSSKRTCLHRTT
jgi:hypothetical protein